MKIFKTQSEVDAMLVNGNLTLDCDVKFEFHVKIAGNISAWDISAWDISARNISARDISAGDISAGNISAWDISAGDISAWDISAGDISFYACCFAYVKFACKSIKGRRENSKYFCLDSEVIIKPDEIVIEEMTMADVCAALGKQIKIIK